MLSDPAAARRRLAERLPGAEVEVYPGTGHGVRGQVPDRVAARVVEFLARHDAPVRPGR